MLDGFKSEIKSEPMEYTETATSNNINKESLNDFGPQVLKYFYQDTSFDIKHLI